MTPDKFYAKTVIVGDCWIWKGVAHTGPYGVAGYAGKSHLAHRLSFYFENGYLPEVVRHSCDTPLCVNPRHLLGGTTADNISDKVSRNRQQQGEGHWNAKLNEVSVMEIRKLVSSGVPQKDVAELFDMSRQQISKIINNKRWVKGD